MRETTRSYGGLVTAPHHLGAQAGVQILREGGNAIEAMIAAASTIAVAYPHMNGLGGDGFWLIGRRGGPMTGIQACGGAAHLASRDWYRERDCEAIPTRGPLSALTVAGTVSGWDLALRISRERFGGRLPLSRLLESAVHHAREGVAVTGTLHQNSRAKLPELEAVPGFGKTILRTAVQGVWAAASRSRASLKPWSSLLPPVLEIFTGGILRGALLMTWKPPALRCA